MQYRRSDYDVTNTVQVSSVSAVKRAVEELYSQTWPNGRVERLDTAFTDFERLFNGQFPGYYGCDTVYHDLQHSLDDTLAMARLLAGYDRTHAAEQRLGAERAMMGIVVALFHDAGYIRQTDDTMHRNGAEFTRTHVGRSAQFLARYLPTLGIADWVPVATQIVHFTGYEVPFDQIRLDDPRDRKVGHLVGTADMIAQMADRCYLEKCRDRLYPEFVLGGVAVSEATRASSMSSTAPASTCCAARRSSSRRPCARGSTASSAAPTAISRRCTAGATRTWKRSSEHRLPEAGADDAALVDAASHAAVLHLGKEPAAEHAHPGDRSPEGRRGVRLIPAEQSIG